MLKYLPWILILLAVILIAVLVVYFYRRYQASAEQKKILQYGRQTENYIFRLIRVAFGPKYALRNLFLPQTVYGKDKVTELDILLATRGGVFVIEVKGSKGKIDNPPTGDWTQTYKEKVLSFHNPFEQNASHIRALSDLLKREKIFNIPMKSVVVFADDNVTFRHRYENLLTAEELIPYLKNASAMHSISRREMRRVIKAVSKHAVRGFGIRRKHVGRMIREAKEREQKTEK